MLQARFLDGRSTRVRHVELSLAGAELVIRGEDVDLRVPVAQVRVDERLGRAARRLRFPDGTCCEVSDLESLDELLVTMGHRDGWVDRVQRSSRHVLIAGVACVLLAAIGFWPAVWAAGSGTDALAAARIPAGGASHDTAAAARIRAAATMAACLAASLGGSDAR